MSRASENLSEQARYLTIGYHNLEFDSALQLAVALKHKGVPLWMDRLDIQQGHVWQTKVPYMLEQSSGFIPILSPDYLASEYGQEELRIARSRGIPIFPVVLRQANIAESVDGLQENPPIDFSQWQDAKVLQNATESLVTQIMDKHLVEVSGFVNPDLRYLVTLRAKIQLHLNRFQYTPISYETQETGQPPVKIRPEPIYGEDWGLNGTFTQVDRNYEQFQTLKGIEEAWDLYQRFVLIGESGAGKTTTLYRLFSIAAQDWEEDSRDAPYPFFVSLGLWEQGKSIKRFISEQFKQRADVQNRVNLDRLLKDGRIVLFLDGLDELGQMTVQQASDLRNWLHSRSQPKRVIISCDADVYMSSLDLNLPLVLRSHVHEEDIGAYLQRAAQAADFSPLQAQLANAPDLQSSALGWAFRKPLLTEMLLHVYQHSPHAALPTNTAQLVERYIYTVWDCQQVLEEGKCDTPQDMMIGLSHLAMDMTSREATAYVTREYAQKQTENTRLIETALSAGLLTQDQDKIRFAHPVLQSVLTAIFLFNTDFELHEYLVHPHFGELHRRQANAWDGALVALTGLVDDSNLFVREIAEVDPYLALECVTYGNHVSPETASFTLEQLLKFAGAQNETGSASAAQSLERLNSQDFETTVLNMLRHGEWQLRQAATNVVREVRTVKASEMLDILNRWDWVKDKRIADAVKQLGGDVLPGLLRLLRGDNMQKRQITAWILGQNQESAAVPALVEFLKDPDPNCRMEAIAALRLIRDHAAVPYLLDAMHDDEPRVLDEAAKALAYMGTVSVPGLLKTLNAGETPVRVKAIGVLTYINDESAVPELSRYVQDQSVAVRYAVVRSLGEFGDPAAIPALAKAVKDQSRPPWSDQVIGNWAIASLEQIGTAEALDAIRAWNTTPATPAPIIAAQQAGTAALPANAFGSATTARMRLGSAQSTSQITLPQLLQEARSEDWETRRDAIAKLGETGDEEVLDVLLNALNDENSDVRLASIKTLHHYPPELVLAPLQESLMQDEYMIYSSAAETLGKIGKPALPTLLMALETKNLDRKIFIIDELGNIGDPAAIPALQKLLTEERAPQWDDRPIRLAAADALRQIGTSDTDVILSGAGLQTTAQEATVEESDYSSDFADILADLTSDNLRVRREAAQRLNKLAQSAKGQPNTNLLTSLMDAMHDENPAIRLAVVEASAWMKNYEVIPVLKNKLYDDNTDVRLATIRALADLRGSDATEHLVALLKDRDPVVREVVAEVLGYFGRPEAIKPLVLALDTEPDELVRRAIVEALGDVGDLSVVPRLEQALREESNNQIRWSAINSLVRIGSPDSMNIFAAHLGDTYRIPWLDENPITIGELAREGLEKIGTPEALEILRNWQDDRGA